MSIDVCVVDGCTNERLMHSECSVRDVARRHGRIVSEWANPASKLCATAMVELSCVHKQTRNASLFLSNHFQNALEMVRKAGNFVIVSTNKNK